ncbi:gamma-tubulin complex component 2-like [Anneissia japonica]|uniref:gamma-tubulin complex component 2-like n=1 Tax=Anneissia japonica TaxID=1529436 RepID=UPI00142564FB|nr:gamma-tubulin complex component 2-like [Anneissia japonica]
MSEFRVHHHVSELLKLLGSKGGEGPEIYTDLLLKNRTQYVSTQVSVHGAKRKIAEFTRTPQDFLKKYDELKSKNVRDLDVLVSLLSKISEDRDVVKTLEKNAKKMETPMDKLALHHSGSKMSDREVSELRNQLLTFASTSSPVQTSESLRRMMRERQTKKNSSVNLPVMAAWAYERPHLTDEFVVSSRGTAQSSVPLGNLPIAVQELSIVQDLLLVLKGSEARYILVRPSPGNPTPREFNVDQSLDVSLQELVYRILPMCSNYSIIMRFVEDKVSFEYGLVNHALSKAMRTLIKEYSILVAQLEYQYQLENLPLQRFWFYIRPCMQTMEILASIASSVERGACSGGSVLSLLHEKTTSMIGDAKAQDLCLYLTQSACAPYFEILEKWIYKGIINDPYCEFMVEENESVHKEKLQRDYNDAYWEQRYTICRDRIPVFLESVAKKILSTGKYLNVIRQCGRSPKCPHAEEILYTLNEREYVDQIEKTFNHASQELIDLLMEERELMAKLRSIKRYFLMEQGDFFVHFMDITEEEMKKGMEEIMPARLESLVELAIRTSEANADPFKDDLKAILLPYDLITQLLRILSIESKEEKVVFQEMDPTEIHISGLEAFSFDYVVRWPYDLLIYQALTKYQMLFRHLFYCKHVERTLCSVWLSNKSAKKFSLRSSKWYAAGFALRQRMLHLVQNLQYYMMFEVIEPNWLMMLESLKSVSNIDDVLEFHTDFLDKCLKDCMLTNPDLLKIVSKLMLVCVTFSNCIQRFTHSMNVEAQVNQMSTESGSSRRKDGKDKGSKGADEAKAKKQTTTKVVAEHVDQLIASEEFERTIINFDTNFSTLLIDLLDNLSIYSTTNCEHNMMNIIHRLDFNGFYTQQLEGLAAERSMRENAQDDDQGISSLLKDASIKLPTISLDEGRRSTKGS